jgi:hypothetical protein
MPNIGVGERPTYDQQVRAKFRRIANANATLGVHDRVVIVNSNSSAVTITLPNVGEAAGKIFTVTAENGLTNNVTIAHAGESKNWANQTLAGNGAQRVLYSDGISWFVLASATGATE